MGSSDERSTIRESVTVPREVLISFTIVQVSVPPVEVAATVRVEDRAVDRPPVFIVAS
ncbi:MAG: hypothetical protein ABEL51_01340 [Salinibacter sp.]